MSADLIVFSADFTLGDAADSRVLTGLAMPYNVASVPMEDGRRHVFKPGAFARSIAERGSKVRLMIEHNLTTLPIGKAVSYNDSADGLRIGFQFADTTRGNEALQLVREGYISGLSAGVRFIKHSTASNGDTVHTESALHEVSLTAEPAMDGAGFRGGSDGPRLDVNSARLRLRIIERSFIHV